MIDWLLGWLWWAWDTSWWLLRSLWDLISGWIRRHPVTAWIFFIGFLRMWGITIQTGQTGVLFSWGRPRRLLEPGFHPLIPIFQTARVMPTRSVTLALPPQRVTSADGLVFDADATLVCRITDPIKATIEIDDLRAGCLTALSLACAEVIAHKTRADIAAKQGLDDELSRRVQADLDRWGVTVEQAGFNTIAPTRTTTRLSQQAKRLRERAGALKLLLAAGVPTGAALALLGTTKQVIGHSRARYHRGRLKPRPVEAAPPEEVVFLDEGEEDEDLPI
jgi:hypothetical protein